MTIAMTGKTATRGALALALPRPTDPPVYRINALSCPNDRRCGEQNHQPERAVKTTATIQEAIKAQLTIQKFRRDIRRSSIWQNR
jgi:hypothetical protein